MSASEPIERGPRWGPRCHVLLAALVLTVANVGKPLVIDDTAFAYYARQIAAAPTDPYGFEIFWYQTTQPAFTVLAPPVLPYWLGGSMRVLGDDPVRWKLALFPFALALAASLHALARRFAPGLATPCLWMAVLLPPVFAFFNLMLDVPAASLALLAIVVFFAACDRRSLALAVASGLVVGLAAQTKYTGLTAGAAILAYGAAFARWRLALVTAVIGGCIFVGWEALMVAAYGNSHLVQSFQNLYPQRLGSSLESLTLWTVGFTILMGALAAPVGLLSLAALGASRRRVGFAASLAALCFAWLPFLPPAATFAMQKWPQLAGAEPEQPYFFLLGIGTVASMAAVAWRLIRRWEREDRFLLAWLAIEIVAFGTLSPLLAARRILVVSLVGLLVCAREFSRGRAQPSVAAVRIPVAASIALGVLFAASDFADALAVRDSVRSAERELQTLNADTARETVWFTGHWGFQFYAERAGMRPLVPDVSRARRGDWVIVTEGSAGQEFQRADLTAPQARVDSHSALPWSTLPWAYGGTIPMRRRPESTLRLWIQRVKQDFVPAGLGPAAARP